MWDLRACSPMSDKLQVILYFVHLVLYYHVLLQQSRKKKPGCFVQHNLKKRLFGSNLIILILFIFLNILTKIPNVHVNYCIYLYRVNFTLKLLECLIKLFCEFLSVGSILLISDIVLFSSKEFLKYKQVQPKITEKNYTQMLSLPLRRLY